MLHGQRETSWQVPYLAPAAEWLTWSGVRGVNVVTHTQIPGYAMTYMAAPCRIPPRQQLTSHSWEKPYGFLSHETRGKPGNQKPQEYKDGECIVLLPLHFRKSVWGCESWQTEQNPCAVVPAKVWADKWFSIQDMNWFSHSWHIISLPFCSSPAKHHTLSGEKKSAVEIFFTFFCVD